MSYCRSNGDDSDVYLVMTGHGLLCFGAGWRLEETHPVHKDSLTITSRTEMIRHLGAHQAAGHKVPDRAFDRLSEEVEYLGDFCGDES